MQAPILIDLHCNLPVALHALERRRVGRNLVALDAVGVAVEALVGFRQRPWRYLRANWHGKEGKNGRQE